MSEKINALLYIVALSFIGFILIKRITQNILPPEEVQKWRLVWFSITGAAYLIPNFWLFLGIALLIIFHFSKAIESKLALYIILLFSFPTFNIEIPGIGGMNYFFNCNFPRFLSLFILLPEALRLARTEQDFRFGKVWTDWWVLLYGLLWFSLVTVSYGIASGLRVGFYMLLELGLPYYVFSRGIKNLYQIKSVFFAFVSVALIIALIGILENRKSWLLYNVLYNQFGVPNAFSYISRGDSLRAMVTFGWPIALGFFMVIALSFYTPIHRDIKNKLSKNLAWLTLLMGLFAPLSRGPWVGLVVFLSAYAIQGRQKLKKIGLLTASGLIIALSLIYLPGGQKYIDLLPFIGTTEIENVTYREILFDNSLSVIKRQPFFGSQGTLDFREEPEMLALKQGQGIVDITNTYLLIALQAGCIALFLFVMMRISTLFRLIAFKKRAKVASVELDRIGNMFIALNISIMIMIATVSTITNIPYIINIVTGLSIAYTRIVSITLNKTKVK